MTHLEIYQKLDMLDDNLNDYIEENNIGEKNEIESLFYSIMCRCGMVIEYSKEVLETQKQFCIWCFILNMSCAQKAISRYFSIENELEENIDISYIEILVECESAFTQIVDSITEKYQDCNEIENTAYLYLNKE